MSNLSFSIRNVLLGLSIAVLPMSVSGAVTRDYAGDSCKGSAFF